MVGTYNEVITISICECLCIYKRLKSSIFPCSVVFDMFFIQLKNMLFIEVIKVADW